MHPSTAADARAALESLNAWLGSQGREGRVTFLPPVTTEDLAAAEGALGRAFPPAYRAYVSTQGTFVIPGALTGRGDGNDTVLLPPGEAAEQTRRYREELEGAGEAESEEILRDAILFCADPTDEFFHLFVVSSASPTGEMKTRGWDYQDPAGNDPWFEGDGDFASVLDGLIENVRRQAQTGD